MCITTKKSKNVVWLFVDIYSFYAIKVTFVVKILISYTKKDKVRHICEPLYDHLALTDPQI